jgi:hypothetical protein
MRCTVVSARPQHLRTADLPRPGIAINPDSRIDSGPVLGTWVNYDESTAGISRLLIRAAGDDRIGVTVLDAGPRWQASRDEAFGSVYSLHPDATEAAAFLIRFPGTFLAAYLNLRLLVVDAYALEPGRSNHFHRDHFYQP